MSSRLQKAQKKLKASKFDNIEISEFRKSIRLEGVLESWEDIVKAGRLFKSIGYKGIVNDIKLKDFNPPKIKAPKIEDKALDLARPDVLIIGGGVIGCAIARELSKYSLDILLVDKESDVAMHTSSRNDGMIHPGVASGAKHLKSKLNVRGNEAYSQLCKDLKIDFERCGNLVLYSDHIFGIAGKAVLSSRCKALNIPNEHLNLKRLHFYEPNITKKAIGAFRFPTAGKLSPYKLTVALAEHAVENGAFVSLNTIVTGMEKNKGKIEKVTTNRGTIYPKSVINAAGVFSDSIAEMADDRFFSIHPRKGEIVILDKKTGPLLTHSMGLVEIKQAFSDTKGGGLVPTIDGNILVGPDAYEHPLKEDFTTNCENIETIMKKHLPLINNLSPADCITYFAGIRAATYEEDFIVEASETVDNLVHAAGIQSPGLASAPAIAEDIAAITLKMLSKIMTVKPNEKFCPQRKAPIDMHKLSFEEKQKVIKENPNYGIIICRCEEVSKGEIIGAIKSPVPATTIDAIKRRVRPGMGRCQGGFCSPLVAELISENSDVPIDKITKNGEDSELFTSKTR